MKALEGITQKLKESAEGKPDVEFWRSFFKLGGGSGGPFISGWINTFFPYTQSRGRWGPYAAAVNWERNGMYGGGENIADMPAGMSSAPFIWHYYATDYKMKFVAGFLGVEQNPETLAVRPGVAWAVTDTQQESPAALQERLFEAAHKFNEPREQKISDVLHKQLRHLSWSSAARQQFDKRIREEKKRYTISFWGDDHGRCILTEEDLQRQDDQAEFDQWVSDLAVEIEQALEQHSN
jgi:hypothetical protein